MKLPHKLIGQSATFFHKNKIAINWIGSDKNESNGEQNFLQNKEFFLEKAAETQNYKNLKVTFAMNYGGQQDILQAITKIVQDGHQQITKALVNSYLLTKNLPDVDLLIRTSGEQRISNFMLWQIAYAEIIFNPVYWPAYQKKHFIADLETYANRQRRFGEISND